MNLRENKFLYRKSFVDEYGDKIPTEVVLVLFGYYAFVYVGPDFYITQKRRRYIRIGNWRIRFGGN